MIVFRCWNLCLHRVFRLHSYIWLFSSVGPDIHDIVVFLFTDWWIGKGQGNSRDIFRILCFRILGTHCFWNDRLAKNTYDKVLLKKKVLLFSLYKLYFLKNGGVNLLLIDVLYLCIISYWLIIIVLLFLIV